MKDQTITLEAAFHQIVNQLNGPTPLDEVVQRVLAVRPSNAKNPAQQVRNSMRYMYWPTWVWLDQRTLLPMRLCMRGVCFRITPSRSEVERNLFYGMPALHALYRRDAPWEAMQFVDAAGRVLPFDLVTVKEKTQTPLGEVTNKNMGFRLNIWFAQTAFRWGDSILATVLDWETGRFQIEHEPARRRRPDEIARRNRELAGLLYDILEESSSESVIDLTAVPTAYARMVEPGGYPGDHWVQVIRQDPRMVWLGVEIRYADWLSPLEAELFDKPAAAKPIVSAEQGRLVYRFKAALKHRPGLWRQIDIQGGQTLAKFDRELRTAFEHDWSDHMSGFWRRVRRGQTTRFREINLGSIDPSGDGEMADTPVAALGLQPGDSLKYVYDFGDWIEHTVTLEEIAEPETGADYPRVGAQNKPRYRYCERCRDRGRKAVAVYICIDCSNRQQRDVLLCDSCAGEEHEDHYVDDLLY
jgi:hypothetical protein